MAEFTRCDICKKESLASVRFEIRDAFPTNDVLYAGRKYDICSLDCMAKLIDQIKEEERYASEFQRRMGGP